MYSSSAHSGNSSVFDIENPDTIDGSPVCNDGDLEFILSKKDSQGDYDI